MTPRFTLLVLRAAAVVTIATGLNEVVAGAVRPYEPLYLFLAAAALVVWLDGVVIGTVAALLACGSYALLFTPRPAALSARLLLPFGACLAVVFVVGTLRAVWRARRRGRHELFSGPVTPLLPPAPAPAPDMSEVLDALEDLRGDLRSVVAELHAPQQRDPSWVPAAEADAELLAMQRDLQQSRNAHSFERARAEGESTRRERLELDVAAAQRSLESAIAGRDAATARVTALEASLEAEGSRANQAAADVSRIQEDLLAARAAGHDLNEQKSALERSLESERLRADLAIAESERSRKDLESGLAEAVAQREMARGEGRELYSRVQSLLKTVDDLHHSIAKNDQKFVAAATTLSNDHEASLGRLAQERDTSRSEARELALRLTSLQTAFAESENAQQEMTLSLSQSRKEREASLTESREHQARIASIEHFAKLERARAAAALAESERLRTETNAKLDQVVRERQAALSLTRGLSERVSEGERALDAERTVAAAALAEAERKHGELEARTNQQVRERQAALDEAGALTGRVAEVEREFEAQRLRVAITSAELERSQTDRTEKVEQTAVERDAARTEVHELSGRIPMLEQTIGDLRQTLADRQREFDEKLQTLAGQVTSNHEGELGKAVEERDAARAENRELRHRVANLERTLESERFNAQSIAAARDVDLERSRTEFDEKLQTLANHLAADHEADIGKAVEEREAVRAEARSLTMRLGAAQRKAEEALQERAAALDEVAQQRRRIEDLERGASAPPQHRTRVLIAHPDPELRTAAQGSLQRAGYDIVTAADGLEALRIANAQQPDVVIADAIMPRMNGRDLCQFLKSQEKTAHIRVILLTRAHEELPMSDLPPDEVLHKPVPLETLKATLAQLVPARTFDPTPS